MINDDSGGDDNMVDKDDTKDRNEVEQSHLVGDQSRQAVVQVAQSLQVVAADSRQYQRTKTKQISTS